LLFEIISNKNSNVDLSAFVRRLTFATALTKDQVNPMLYGSNNVSTRTLLKLTAVALFLLCGVEAAFAANTGVTPMLVPYSVYKLAGNGTVTTATAGFSGDGLAGSLAAVGNPVVLTVDSAGNVYFPDRSNGVIREVNAQTGIILTIAGQVPTGCVNGASCTSRTGCSDGVPALGNPIGGNMQGIAIDAYGNIYFSDVTTESISVIYRGGAQVANFIKLVNPTGVATSGGTVKLGYVYHVAGSVNLTGCAASTSRASSQTLTAIPAGDGQLAYNGGGSAVTVTFGSVGPLGLDSAGNLYIGDAGVNNVVRVINTQAAPQTFFAKQVMPGYIQSIVNCGTLTGSLCPAISGVETTGNTGVGGPAAGGVFNTPASSDGDWMSVDAYGNIYEVNYKGATPSINLAVAYAGGSALAKLITAANTAAGALPATSAGAIANAGGLTPTPGDFYYLLWTITLRPSSIVADPFGDLYYADNHYGNVFRFDANAVAYSANYLEIGDQGGKSDGGMFQEGRSQPATTAAPVFCFGNGSGETINTTTPTLTGYQTSDVYGDGCPVQYAEGLGITSATNGFGTVVTDGRGNLFMADQDNQRIAQVLYNDRFPVTPVGQLENPTTFAGQQTLKVHFDSSNLPIETTPAPSVTTTSLQIAPGISDFTINTNTSLYTNASTPAVIGNPPCSNLTGNVDSSLDCIVNVIFSPTAPGLRESQLVVTTQNGSVYTMGLAGIGTGGQLAIDGGTQTVVPVTGLGNPGQIAVSQFQTAPAVAGQPVGTIYIADPANNRVVSMPAAGGPLTSIGTGLKNPMGVAVDVSGNVYIADTGNNRVLKVSQATGAQTALGGILAVGTPAYTQYAFKGPQGVAVDLNGNVYVADTGNAMVVEIPAHPDLGGATPMLQYPGAPGFVTPIGVAVDQNGNIYVVDTGNVSAQIVKIPAGGGDYQTLPSAVLAGYGVNLQVPSGVAVDGAGNVYISDSGANQVVELPAATGPGSEQFALGFTGLNLTGSSPSVTKFSGGSLALDANGNLYVADSGNSRILFENRQNPTLQFGTVPQDAPSGFLPACSTVPNTSGPPTCTLTVTNIGNVAQAVPNPFGGITGTAAFTTANTCPAGSTLAPGLHCTITASFLPTTDGAQSATIGVNATQAITVSGTGEQPLVNIVLSVTAPAGGPVVGQPATVTATVTQPNISGDTPAGPIAFTFTDSCAADTGGSMTVMLTPSGAGTSTASFTLPALQEGRQYTVNATYTDDALNSPTVAKPLVFYIPGITVTATAASVTYVYGSAVPAITGTVTPALVGATSTFVTTATPSSPVGVYPITLSFSGASACNYGLPSVFVPGTTNPATVTETPAPLTITANNASTIYGAQNVSFTSTEVGTKNGDKFSETYTLPSGVALQSSLLPAGTYSIVPVVAGLSITAKDYTQTVKDGVLTIATAPTAISTFSTPAPSVLPTALSTDPLTIALSTGVPGGNPTELPTGTVTITDVFTAIIATAPGTAPPVTTTIGPLTLVNGTVTYTPTSAVLGTHAYSLTYGGDANFQPVTSAAPVNLIIDNADFVVSSTTTPVQIAPGVIPGGLSTVAGESAATPETATVTVTSILSYATTVYLGCTPQNPTYVTCTLGPPSVTVPKPTSGTTASTTSIISIQTPANLPLGFKFPTSSQLRRPASETMLAFLPLGILAFCVRRRRRLSNALWMLLAVAIMSTGLNGCGDNSVAYFTPVPSGPQTVTIYACSVQSACTNPISGTGSGVIRSFSLPINIQ
jgi:sugar lactone lactonase YvrE